MKYRQLLTTHIYIIYRSLQGYSGLHHHHSCSVEVTICQGSFLILGLIIIICLSLLPNVFVLAKVEKVILSESYAGLAMGTHYVNALTDKGLENYTGAILYHDKALGNNTFIREVNNHFPGDNIYLHAKVTVNGFEVMTDVAVTNEQQTKGLDIKNNLTEDQGMLFVFQQPGKYGFWMNGMKFPIDIIWLDSNGTVTHIEHSLKPCPTVTFNLFCPTYSPEKDSQYVLETIAGFSMKHDVRVGTHVSLELVK